MQMEDFVSPFADNLIKSMLSKMIVKAESKARVKGFR